MDKLLTNLYENWYKGKTITCRCNTVFKTLQETCETETPYEVVLTKAVNTAQDEEVRK